MSSRYAALINPSITAEIASIKTLINLHSSHYDMCQSKLMLIKATFPQSQAFNAYILQGEPMPREMVQMSVEIVDLEMTMAFNLRRMQALSNEWKNLQLNEEERIDKEEKERTETEEKAKEELEKVKQRETGELIRKISNDGGNAGNRESNGDMI